MMEDYFSLIRPPFEPDADAYFYFDSDSHHRALSSLQYGLQQDGRIVAVIGETGMGKTTLLEQFLAMQSGTGLSAVRLDATALSRGLRAAFLQDIGLIGDAGDQAVQGELSARANMGNRVVLLVDAAEALGPDDMAAVLHLAGMARDSGTPLQIFLFAQPVLADRIADMPGADAITVSRLMPLSEDDTAAYIDHRLFAAGYEDEQSLFTDKAQDLIHRTTGGVPGAINALCDRVLGVAANADKEFIDSASVEAAIAAEAPQGAPTDTYDMMATASDNVASDADAVETSAAPLDALPSPQDMPEPAMPPAADLIIDDPVFDDSPVAGEDSDTLPTAEDRQAAAVDAEFPDDPIPDEPVVPDAPAVTGDDHSANSAGEEAGAPVFDRVFARRQQGAGSQDEAGEAMEALAREIAASTASGEQDEDMYGAAAEDNAPSLDELIAELGQSPSAAADDDSRVAGLKRDLDGFVIAVRDGLREVEASMETVTGKIETLEDYRRRRASLIQDRLEQIETLLRELKGTG